MGGAIFLNGWSLTADNRDLHEQCGCRGQRRHSGRREHSSSAGGGRRSSAGRLPPDPVTAPAEPISARLGERQRNRRLRIGRRRWWRRLGKFHGRQRRFRWRWWRRARSRASGWIWRWVRGWRRRVHCRRYFRRKWIYQHRRRRRSRARRSYFRQCGDSSTDQRHLCE